jgi:hypothetical protein
LVYSKRHHFSVLGYISPPPIQCNTPFCFIKVYTHKHFFLLLIFCLFICLERTPHTSNFSSLCQIWGYFPWLLSIKPPMKFKIVLQCHHLLHFSTWAFNLCNFSQIDLKSQFVSSIKHLIELIRSSSFNTSSILVFGILILTILVKLTLNFYFSPR